MKTEKKGKKVVVVETKVQNNKSNNEQDKTNYRKDRTKTSQRYGNKA